MAEIDLLQLQEPIKEKVRKSVVENVDDDDAAASSSMSSMPLGVEKATARARQTAAPRVPENLSAAGYSFEVPMTVTVRQSDRQKVSITSPRNEENAPAGLSESPSPRLIEFTHSPAANSQSSSAASQASSHPSPSFNGWKTAITTTPRTSVEPPDQKRTPTKRPSKSPKNATVVSINEITSGATSLGERLSPQDQIGLERGNRVHTSHRPTLLPSVTSVGGSTRGNEGKSSRDSEVHRNSERVNAQGSQAHDRTQDSGSHNRNPPSLADVNTNTTRQSEASSHIENNHDDTTARITASRHNSSPASLVTTDNSSSNHSIGEQTNKTSNITQQQQQLPLLSTLPALSRHTMGHTNNPGTITTAENTWNVPPHHYHHSSSSSHHHHSDSDKMESSTQRTENEDDDDTTIRSFESTRTGDDATSTDGASMTPQRGYSIPESHLMSSHTTVLGTPSTTSTAPSTDDAASWSFDASALGNMGLGGGGGGGGAGSGSAAYHHQHHRRVPSWEGLTHSFHHQNEQQQQQSQQPGYTNQFPQAQGAWGPTRVPTSTHTQQPQQRVATFRGENQGYPPTVPAAGSGSRWPAQQTQPQQQHTQLPFLPQGDGSRGSSPAQYRPAPRPSPGPGAPSYNPYQMQQQQQPQQQHERRQGSSHGGHYGAAGAGGPPLPPTLATPPRGGPARGGDRRLVPVGQSANSPHRGPSPQQSPGASAGGGMGSGGGARSSSEILKTLLRKKACLYEPDTSRAVTLITWLVGRYLALENGFFSRQQLQAGVHSCIANKIESGVITRTKVNRCMQIILNSCFHYIIPRPDGTEENGASFRQAFAKEVSDDEFLLRVLPAPWNDMVVDKEAVLKASFSDDVRQGGKASSLSPTQTPQSSPKLASVNSQAKTSPGADSNEGVAAASDKGDETKRAVLLCFNENVRCAEDVFRCHNEFIRDTAHASNLQLSSPEWRLFFGKDAASAPYLWGGIGIPVTHREGNKDGSTVSTTHHHQSIDALGVMTNNEAAVFRTSWCAKRYDHNHELCGFAHNEVNGGWLRRNPNQYKYKDIMCPSVSKLVPLETSNSNKVLVLNECPHGVECAFAHSAEEILYHPRRYKERVCSLATRPGGCRLGDVCSHFHPLESYRFPKKSDMRSPRHGRQSHLGGGGGNKGASSSSSSAERVPSGAPILYASPAPLSSFDKQILTPGLKSLYRRHAAVQRAVIRAEKHDCHYSYFGDDAGLLQDDGEANKNKNNKKATTDHHQATDKATTPTTNNNSNTTIVGSPTSPKKE